MYVSRWPECRLLAGYCCSARDVEHTCTLMLYELDSTTHIIALEYLSDEVLLTKGTRENSRARTYQLVPANSVEIVFESIIGS